MYEVPPMPGLDELHMDAMAIQTLLDSQMLDEPNQIMLTRELRGLHNSIAFIEKLGG